MQNQTEKLQGIQRYYTRTIQSEYANNYYIEPSFSQATDPMTAA